MGEVTHESSASSTGWQVFFSLAHWSLASLSLISHAVSLLVNSTQLQKHCFVSSIDSVQPVILQRLPLATLLSQCLRCSSVPVSDSPCCQSPLSPSSLCLCSWLSAIVHVHAEMYVMRMRGGARKHYSVREVELGHNVLCIYCERVTDIPYIYIHIQFAHTFHVYVGLAQARPNHAHS